MPGAACVATSWPREWIFSGFADTRSITIWPGTPARLSNEPAGSTGLVAVRLGQRRFASGGGTPVDPADARRRYIAALRAADAHDLGPLLAFARS